MLARYLPILEWGRSYDRGVLTSDLLAAVIVTIMLIPQSLAYAMLAGLPPVVGLYASILPLVAYALFGTSRTLAVGPVAVVSLMTASAAGAVAAPGTAEYWEAAITLAALSGVKATTAERIFADVGGEGTNGLAVEIRPRKQLFAGVGVSVWLQQRPDQRGSGACGRAHVPPSIRIA
jgi:hypothetical protein